MGNAVTAPCEIGRRRSRNTEVRQKTIRNYPPTVDFGATNVPVRNIDVSSNTVAVHAIPKLIAKADEGNTRRGCADTGG